MKGSFFFLHAVILFSDKMLIWGSLKHFKENLESLGRCSFSDC